MENTELNFGKEPVGSLLFKLAIPAVIGLLLQSVYMMIDGIFVGQGVGPEGLAAVNLTMPVLQVSTALAFMLMVGGTTYTAMALGRGDQQEAKRIYAMVGKVLLLLSGLLCVLGVSFSESLAAMLGAQGSVSGMVSNYLTYISLFLPVLLFAMYLDGGMRLIGKPMIGMYVLAGTAVLNVGLDYLLIMKLQMGVTGAAVATGLAQVVGVLALLPYFTRKDALLKLYWAPLDIRVLKPVLLNGFSEFATGIATGISTFLFNLILMRLKGPAGVSAYAIVSYMAMIIFMNYLGIAMAMQPIVSYNMGAGDRKRGEKAMRYAAGVSAVIGVCSALLLYAFGGQLSAMFVGDQPALVDLARTASRFAAFMLLPAGINVLLSAYFTAVDRPVESAVVALLRSLGFVGVGLHVLPMFFGIHGVWASLPVAEAATLVVSYGLLTGPVEQFIMATQGETAL